MSEFDFLDCALTDELLYLVSGGTWDYYLGYGECSIFGACPFCHESDIDCAHCVFMP